MNRAPTAKLERARELRQNGWSLRAIERETGLCRATVMTHTAPVPRSEAMRLHNARRRVEMAETAAPEIDADPEAASVLAFMRSAPTNPPAPAPPPPPPPAVVIVADDGPLRERMRLALTSDWVPLAILSKLLGVAPSYAKAALGDLRFAGIAEARGGLGWKSEWRLRPVAPLALSDRERLVVTRRDAGEQQAEIGKDLGVSRARVCQIEQQARRKLQKLSPSTETPSVPRPTATTTAAPTPPPPKPAPAGEIRATAATSASASAPAPRATAGARPRGRPRRIAPPRDDGPDVATRRWLEDEAPVSPARARLALPEPEARKKVSYKDLSRDDELALILRYQKGDKRAGDILVEANEAFIYKMAMKSKGRGLDPEDLMQEARMGFLKGVERYDAGRGFRLLTYAGYWTRQTTRRAVMDTGLAIRIPVHIQDKLVHGHMQGANTPEAMAAAGLMSEKRAAVMLQLNRGTLSLDAPASAFADDDRTLADGIAGTSESPEESYEREERAALARKAVDVLLDGLTERERDIILSRLGQNDGDEQTLKVIGERHGITRERIRQLQADAAGKMRANANRLGAREVARLLPMLSIGKTTASLSDRVLAALKRDGELGVDGLRTRVGASRDKLLHVLERLLRRNQVTRDIRGGIYYFQWKDEPPEDDPIDHDPPPPPPPAPPPLPGVPPRRTLPFVRPRDQSSFVVYRGPSALNGSLIVGIVTNVAAKGMDRSSLNGKLGPMAQLHILVADEAPNLAKNNGRDAAVCGDCVLRSGKGPVRCYVNVAFSTTTLWKANAWRPVEMEACAAAIQHFGLHVRLGAYGDPAALPEGVIVDLVKASAGATGYTHDWRHPRSAWLKKYAMASVETGGDFARAQALGWRTYRIVLTQVSRVDTEEVICPSVTHGRHCDECRLCDGSRSPDDARKNIAVPVHGQQTNASLLAAMEREEPSHEGAHAAEEESDEFRRWRDRLPKRETAVGGEFRRARERRDDPT